MFLTADYITIWQDICVLTTFFHLILLSAAIHETLNSITVSCCIPYGHAIKKKKTKKAFSAQ